MFKTCFILLSVCLVLCIACNSQNDVAGYYLPDLSITTRLKWRLKGKKDFGVGTKLLIYRDSTFDFHTCGCKSNGRWKIARNQIHLTHTSVHSTPQNISGIDKCYLPDNYIVDYERLIGMNGEQYIEILKKSDDIN